jgi:3-oxoacyl-[acyl-carrier protein] reductase
MRTDDHRRRLAPVSQPAHRGMTSDEGVHHARHRQRDGERVTALVTGANSGIGAATAIELAARGHAVLAAYLRGAPGGDEYERQRARDAGWVIDAIAAAGGTAEALEADLADPAAAARLFDHAERTLGPVDILVCNASGWVQDTFTPATADRFGRAMQPVSADTFDRQFAVDARATALLIAELARRHVERGGEWARIVTLTSRGPAGFPSEVSYGAAKAALENYTLSAAAELGTFGVTANVVHPPVTDTGWITPQVRAAVPRVGEPEDVARVIAMLCSPDARHVTGNVLRMR